MDLEQLTYKHLGVVAVSVIALILFFFVGVPNEYIARAELVSKFLTLLAVLGGLYVAARRIRAAEDQAAAATRSAEAATGTAQAANEQARIAEEGQVTDRFTKAVEHLSSGKPGDLGTLAIRLGGIYALERIARDSERDHWPVMQLLCAYVRENYPWDLQSEEEAKSDQDDDGFKGKAPSEIELQTILDVVRNRKHEGRESDEHRLDFHGADLSDMNLSGAYLRGASLDADIAGLDLSNADLRGAWPGWNCGGVDFSGADLNKANLRPANFDRADFRDANLTGADLRSTYYTGETPMPPMTSDLSGAKNLTQEQIDSAIGDDDTKLPEGLQHPTHWTVSDEGADWRRFKEKMAARRKAAKKGTSRLAAHPTQRGAVERRG